MLGCLDRVGLVIDLFYPDTLNLLFQMKGKSKYIIHRQTLRKILEYK